MSTEKPKRILVLYLENEEIGDGFFATEVALTLREYADMIDAGKASRNGCEIQEGARGTRLTAIGVAWNGERIQIESTDEKMAQVGREDALKRAHYFAKVAPGQDAAACALKAVISHWHDFGPEHGFDECLEMAARALRA